MKNLGSSTRLAAKSLATALILSILAACGGGDSLPAEKQYFRVHTIENLAYGPEKPGNLLDLHLPQTGQTAPLPLLIYHAGSAWLSNTSKDAPAANTVATEFTARGFAVATISIRASTDARFPAQGYDVRAAIRWLRENAAKYNIDPNSFAFMGDSSGGWATTFAAATSGIAQLPGETVAKGTSSAVKVAVPFYPPLDFLSMDDFATANNLPKGFAYPHNSPTSPESLLVQCPGEPAPTGLMDTNPALLSIQACPNETKAANPISYITSKAVPMWVMHGLKDPLLPFNQSELLYAKLKSFAGVAKITIVPDAVHDFSTIIGAAKATTRTTSGGQEQTSEGTGPSWDDIEKFIRDNLK